LEFGIWNYYESGISILRLDEERSQKTLRRSRATDWDRNINGGRGSHFRLRQT